MGRAGAFCLSLARDRRQFRVMKRCLAAVMAMQLCAWSCPAADAAAGAQQPLWALAQSRADAHRFSVLFTAQDVRDSLSSEADIDRAIGWCLENGVTRVYIEAYRGAYWAERATLLRAKERFLARGFLVSGCVTTTQVGKRSTGWSEEISCYTDQPTQEKLQSIFEYAASLFDEIMIDDFYFTECACPECDAARKARVAVVGDGRYPVDGDTWSDYRRELMLRVSIGRVLGPARRVNPHVRIIIKYPNWHDKFAQRGYDVASETAAFDRIWVGTETRDFNDPRWGGLPAYGGYFIMRWLGGIGGDKCGGGWFDSLGTTPHTYVEQARQTVLGGARESMLFNYSGLHRGPGPDDVAALRAAMPELLDVAAQVASHRPVGVAAYNPPNSQPLDEALVFDFAGMLGLPLAPCHRFPANEPAAMFSEQALSDPNLAGELAEFVRSGRPTLVTDGLKDRLKGTVDLDAPNVQVLAVNGKPRSLLQWDQPALDAMRRPLLAALHATFRAPNGVALYLFNSNSWVVENFNDQPASVELNGEPMTIEARGWRYLWR
jgi:hypothetical protein